MFSLMRPGASGRWVGVRQQEAKCVIAEVAVQPGGLGRTPEVQVAEDVGCGWKTGI